jgi:hypothetical protein
MGSPSTPTPPDPAKSYEQGLQLSLQYLPKFLAAEQASRSQYDPARVAEQQGLQNTFGEEQYKQQLAALNQLDPNFIKTRDALASTVQGELANGSQLSPSEEQQVQGYARAAQAARGNTLGNAPATAEAYALGDRGRQILQQGVSNASAFLASPTVPGVLNSVAPVSADRSFSYANPNAGIQGQQFALQNYQNQLGASQLSGGNPWGSALGGAAAGASAGSAFGPYGTAIGAIGGGIGGYLSNSDRRLKEAIMYRGTVNGIKFYDYVYIGQPDDHYTGVMADEVEHIPEAVITGPGGFKMVDYDIIKSQMERPI